MDGWMDGFIINDGQVSCFSHGASPVVYLPIQMSWVCSCTRLAGATASPYSQSSRRISKCTATGPSLTSAHPDAQHRSHTRTMSRPATGGNTGRGGGGSFEHGGPHMEREHKKIGAEKRPRWRVAQSCECDAIWAQEHMGFNRTRALDGGTYRRWHLYQSSK